MKADIKLRKKEKLVCENRSIMILEKYKQGMIQQYENMNIKKSEKKEMEYILAEILDVERNIKLLKKNISYENI